MALLYTTVESVKARLTNKVQFQGSPAEVEQGELPNELLLQIIQDAETDVEMELRSRYAVPFKSIRTGLYKDLPDHTKRVIRKLCDYKASMLVLKTDFGRGTHVDGDTYLKSLSDEFKDAVQLALGRDAIGRNDKIDRHKYSPPLDDLVLAKSNAKADDGYRGTIINTDARCDSATYAEEQINDPSKSWLRTRNGGL